MRRMRHKLGAVAAAALLAAGLALAGSGPGAAPARAEANGVGQVPAMGWSSWSFLRHNPTEAGIEAQAKAMHDSGLQGAGYQYVNVDDFWYPCPGSQGPGVDSYGRWAIDTTRFPSSGGVNGIAATADYVHNLGLKFGLYVTPGISAQAVAQKTPIEGTSATADQIAEPSVSEHNYNCGGMDGIDYSKPGAQQFVNSWADQLASWGVDYVKLDGVGSSDVPDVKAWSQALRQTGRPIHLELSNSLDINSAPTWQQYANGWRTGGDIECYSCESGGSFPLTDWSHVATRFDQVAAWKPYGGPGGFNDYDSIEVGNGSNDGLTADERKTQLSLWSLASSPLTLGTDLTSLDSADLALLKNQAVIAVDQDGIDAHRVTQTSTSQVFAKTESSGDVVAGLFNTGDTAETVSTATAALAMPASSDFQVADLWTGQSTETTGAISEVVPPHGVALVKITPTHDASAFAPNVTLNVTGITNLAGGKPATVTESFTDNGSRPVQNVQLGLTAPAGWSLASPSPSAFSKVGSGATVSTTYTLTAPTATSVNQTGTLTATAQYTDSRKAAHQLTTQPQATLAPPPVQPPYRTYSSANDAPAGYSQSGQQFTISGGGKPMFTGYGDGYSSIYLPGGAGSNFTAETEITSEKNMTNYWAQAGIIVRNDMTGSGTSPEGVALSWGPDPNFGTNMWWSDNGGNVLDNVMPNNYAINVSLPVWLKLTRAGDVYTSYYSTDGSTWTQIASETVPGQAATQDIGMFVSSGQPGQPAQATFNGLSVTNG